MAEMYPTTRQWASRTFLRARTHRGAVQGTWRHDSRDAEKDRFLAGFCMLPVLPFATTPTH
jgi:hypothetical protein